MKRIASALTFAATAWAVTLAQTSAYVPRIWSDAALAEWATPVAGLNVRPAHYLEGEYYAAPADNFRTYPVYRPDREPAGYWDHLQTLKPEPLVDSKTIHSKDDWIAAGERAFRTIDSVLMRTNDPQIIASARGPQAFTDDVFTRDDGSVLGVRWVVTDKGVMLSSDGCILCHHSVRPDGSVVLAGPAGPGKLVVGAGLPRLPVIGPEGTSRRLRAFYRGDSVPVAFWREYTTPWVPDERVEAIKTMRPGELQKLQIGGAFSGGVFARSNGSPYYMTKIADLQNIRYSHYLDATGTHRVRGADDLARYAALVGGADSMEFGPHRILTDEQRPLRFRYADEVLYAIGVYLMSLEPPNNPESRRWTFGSAAR